MRLTLGLVQPGCHPDMLLGPASMSLVMQFQGFCKLAFKISHY